MMCMYLKHCQTNRENTDFDLWCSAKHAFSLMRVLAEVLANGYITAALET